MLNDDNVGELYKGQMKIKPVKDYISTFAKVQYSQGPHYQRLKQNLNQKDKVDTQDIDNIVEEMVTNRQTLKAEGNRQLWSRF